MGDVVTDVMWVVESLAGLAVRGRRVRYERATAARATDPNASEGGGEGVATGVRLRSAGHMGPTVLAVVIQTAGGEVWAGADDCTLI